MVNKNNLNPFRRGFFLFFVMMTIFSFLLSGCFVPPVVDDDSDVVIPSLEEEEEDITTLPVEYEEDIITSPELEDDDSGSSPSEDSPNVESPIVEEEENIIIPPVVDDDSDIVNHSVDVEEEDKTNIDLVQEDVVLVPVLNGAIIANHEAADNFDIIPTCWIEKVKQDFRIGYGHTSHGSQIASGIRGLNTILNNDGVYPKDLFSMHPSGYNGALLLFEGGSYADGTWLAYDVGYNNWDTRTRDFLNSDKHGDKNVIMWSWCGQVNDVDLQTHYFDNMVALETEYPDVDFIYMTGHLESNEAVLSANNKIRDHVKSRNGILFDFADIEKWDPTPKEHPLDTDACNWCSEWCDTQEDCTEILNAISSCSHSHDYNCYRKAKAFWWMLARMAGWDGTVGDDCE